MPKERDLSKFLTYVPASSVQVENEFDQRIETAWAKDTDVIIKATSKKKTERKHLLCSISMNRGRWKTIHAQPILQRVSSLLCLHKD